MGYRSDVRVLLPETEFDELDKKIRALKRFPKYDVLSFRDEDADSVRRYAPEREPIRFVYFGWNDIKWYDEEFIRAVESVVNKSNYVHFLKIDAHCSCVEERYMLEEAFVDCISISRHFDDEI